MDKKPVAWSYSALNSFETCPHRHFKTRIDKSVDDPMGEAALWGNRVHKALEEYIKNRKPLPNGMEDYLPLVETVMAMAKDKRVNAEQKICLNAKLRPTEYFAKDAYLRVITDFNIDTGKKIFVGDWKTGRENPDSGQLKLAAAAMMQAKPYIEEVHSAFIWLKTKNTTVEKYTREDLPDIWAEFLPRAQRLDAAVKQGNFPKRPSGLCKKHCPVKSCEFNGFYTGAANDNREEDEQAA